MPKPIPFGLAFVSMIAYAFIIVELKPLTRQYNIIVLATAYLPLQVLITIIALLFVWGTYVYNGQVLVWPQGQQWLYIAAFALAFFVAQNLNTAVYATGGTPEMMSYMALLLPIFVPLLGYFFHEARLNWWHGAAFAAAVAMTYCLVQATSAQAAQKLVLSAQ